MCRLARVLIVALLAVSASGAAAVVVPEPCTGYEAAGSDRQCPPTCATCGCCAQAIEPVVLAAPLSPDARIGEVSARPSRLPAIDPRDILHVPRPRFV